MNEPMQQTCPDEMLAEAMDLTSRDEAAGCSRVAELVNAYPLDPRLHFLLGSLLASQSQYAEARKSMHCAVDLAPRYDVARFQLGLLELSSGDAIAAKETLAPLAVAESGSGLSLLAQGLVQLASDDLAAAAASLRRGLSQNLEHPLINRDMEMMIAEIEARLGAPAPDEEISAAHQLLRQYDDKLTRH